MGGTTGRLRQSCLSQVYSVGESINKALRNGHKFSHTTRLGTAQLLKFGQAVTRPSQTTVAAMVAADDSVDCDLLTILESPNIRSFLHDSAGELMT